MTVLKERITEKLDRLPESDLREVLDFVEFLTWRTSEPYEPLLRVAGSLSGEMPSADEIERELYGENDGA
jgi:hypothetical protein